MICGETGSGKTVLTRALLKSLHKDERVIILEDVHEVTVDHVVEAVYMMYGDAGKIDRVSATDALRACMRLTPGRIIMTELRDDAAWDYLKALNTGTIQAVLCQRTLTLRAMPLTVLGCLSRRPLSVPYARYERYYANALLHH